MKVVEAMLYGCAAWTMRSRHFGSLRTTSYFCASSAFGARIVPDTNLYRIERPSKGPVPNASKRQFGSANLGLPGPLFCKVTEGSQSESCLGGWRYKGPSEEAVRRRLGRTASKNTSRPRGDPVQRQRTEMGRIRSCCQGWTGLDDCCEERGHVAPGGLEGSGNTRSSLATRRPSPIQRTAPARG